VSHFVEILEQTAIWRGQDGRTYYVGELDDEYLGNILAYLGRHAARLLQERRDLDEFELPPRSTDYVRELETIDPYNWLADRPLYRRLLAEQRRRASVDGEVVPNVGVIADAAD
jgi:hypothetical protein